MSIPDDIMKVAVNAAMDCDTEHMARRVIADALLAERQSSASLIKELVEALEPFGKMEIFFENANDEDLAIITIGTVKRCRSALAKAKERMP